MTHAAFRSSLRIGQYCGEIARSLGLDAEFCDCIEQASPLHDLGEVAIAESILLEPGPLNRQDWQVMKTHTALGAKMLERANSPIFEMGREIAMAHHEHWDGSGYPFGSAGEEIPLSARIVAICDCYDSLRIPKLHGSALDHESACAVILHGDPRTSPAHSTRQCSRPSRSARRISAICLRP